MKEILTKKVNDKTLSNSLQTLTMINNIEANQQFIHVASKDIKL